MKYKAFSILFSILLVITLPLALCSCGSKNNSSNNEEIVLRIANWEEYLDEGDWDDDEEIKLENGKKIIGRNTMIKDFEKWYEKTYHKKVKVEYSSFGTNEDMYNQLTIGDTYDLICPSEYMIMKLLADTYHIEREDLMSAELEVVPAGKARDCGLDRSMVMAYGQDDRICAYTSLAAMLDVETVSRTSCCILVDKEEIGSVGATGMHSRFFENAVADLYEKLGGFSELKLRRTLARSTMISSDVSAAYDPMYTEVYDKKSTSFFGKGPVFCKHTGSRGKSGSNDANAEYIAKLRNVFDAHEVHFQMAELGKVDAGGGGTIAYILAQYGMEVIDGGVAVLCMHAPWEISSKADVYEAYRGYCAFLKDMK